MMFEIKISAQADNDLRNVYENIAKEIEKSRNKNQSLSVEESEFEGLKARIQEIF